MKTNKILFLMAISAFFCTTSVFAQKKKDKPLDNRNYTITLTEEASAKPTKPMPDELSFKSEKLKSKVMTEKYKFKPGSFTATVDSSNAEEVVITFDAEMKGETGDILIWHGTVIDDDIEGSAIWTKKGKTKKSFAFSGSIKKKK